MVKITILPYIEPKRSERTWNRKGYVASKGAKTVNLKDKGFRK
jgi:hypothetical protein